MKNVMVVDCEARSLHDPTFCVGSVVFDLTGKEVDRFELLSTENLAECCVFVKENILPHLVGIKTCNTDLELRNSFFEFYRKHKINSTIWGDVIFPVETNLFSMMVNDAKAYREWDMPYPLYDIANFVPVSINRAREYNLDLAHVATRKLKSHCAVDDCIASFHCLKKYAMKEMIRICI